MPRGSSVRTIKWVVKIPKNYRRSSNFDKKCRKSDENKPKTVSFTVKAVKRSDYVVNRTSRVVRVSFDLCANDLFRRRSV